MTDGVKYWIWLQMALGYACNVKGIAEEFGSAENLYNSTLRQRTGSGLFSLKKLEKIDNISVDATEETIYACRQNGWDIITYDDSRYPDKLRDTDTPPAVLYCDGKFPDFDNYASVGMVGTRNASPYALTVSRLMAHGLAECGAIIVSGGALGVDSAAHTGALDANGITVAVLGCGLGTNYLKKNQRLRRKIKENGALITEFMPFTKAEKHTFPMRNRIISGLSDGLFVGEAGEKSGSLITANCAIDQGRDIFVVPSSVLDDRFLGCNKLIEQGASVATSPKRILECYANKYDTVNLDAARTITEIKNNTFVTGTGEPKALDSSQYSFDTITEDRHNHSIKEQQAYALEGNEKLIFDATGDEPAYIDTISDRAGVDAKHALISMTLLEMKGLVEALPGKLYKRK